jgi:hypoxanthine phosphoribosyltransferase
MPNKSTSIEHIKQVMNTAECLYDASDVTEAYNTMAREITRKLKGLNPLLICLMNGGIVSMGQLLPRLDFILQVDFIHATRYRDSTKGEGELDWKVMPHHKLQGRHILLIDDILDEGMTLYEVMKFCEKEGAAAIYSAVLADKQHDRRQPEGFQADFTGITIEDRYVFGCGMDYKGYWRNANGIYAVSRDLLN